MEKSENKKRFNVIDIIILVLVIALIGGLVWFFFFKDTTKSNETQYSNGLTFTLLIKAIDNKSADIIKVGDMIYNSSTGNTFGVVTKIEKKQTEYVLNQVDESKTPRSAKTSQYPDLFDVYVTISTNCRVLTNGICVVDNNPILIGKQLYIKDDIFATSSYVVGFTLE